MQRKRCTSRTASRSSPRAPGESRLSFRWTSPGRARWRPGSLQGFRHSNVRSGRRLDKVCNQELLLGRREVKTQGCFLDQLDRWNLWVFLATRADPADGLAEHFAVWKKIVFDRAVAHRAS